MYFVMKIKTLLALIAFIITLCAPIQITLHSDPDKGTASLFTLNVCTVSGAVFSSQVDIPCVPGCPCILSLFENTFTYRDFSPVFSAFLITYQQERPPKA